MNRFVGAMTQNGKVTKIEVVENIDQGEEQVFLSHINTQTDFLNDLDYFLAISESFSDLKTFVDTIKAQKLNETQFESNRYIYRTLQRHFLNYMNTVYMFEHHASKKLSEDQRHTFDKILRKYYDADFNFRFIKRLRNFSQHVSFSITKFEFNESKNSSAKFNIAFDIDHLLSDFDKWSTVKSDLQRLREKSNFIDIIEPMERYNHLVEDIFYEYLMFKKDNLVGCFNYFIKVGENVKMKFDGQNFGNVGLYDVSQNEHNTTNLSYNLIQPYFMKMVQPFILGNYKTAY